VRVQSLKASEPILGYTVTERIGAGGYGEVWKADAPGGLTKAIKFVYGFLDDDRASRELKALNRIKQVRHPFLLSLERIEVVDGQLIIVTELADMSLKDRHEQCKAAGLVGIPRHELLTYMHDAADALDYMRESFSLQHLDVKPENLLLVGGRVKVADFGLVKDIHDKTASLMGGLTPVYAPPEVFDDRPSHFSDQYSLAIVYQELLTDVLPFPGRTAAQLAAQHLQSRPRLGPLPPSDQPVIARSLSKEPEKRYPSCRGMVDALMELGGSSPSHRASPTNGAPAVVEPEADTASAAVCATLPSMRPPPALTDHPVTQPRQDGLEARRSGSEPAAPPLSAPIPQRGQDAAPCLTEVRDGQSPKPRSTTVLPARLATPRPRVAPVVTELPPIDVADTAATLRPTLFLGIGGTGASTLARLRQRLHDRLGGLDAAPAFGILLLDTDPKTLHLATQGEEGAALALQETLALPLRRTEDYRSGSAQLLQWMSRRWLYNIPRSLQTEGLRPLGRLALVDHAAELFKRLHAALAAVTSPEALKTTSERTGLSISDVTPRVFIITSIAGGTGSGMALDAAYAVRKVLADLGQPDNSVYGILTHSTGRKAATRDLAIANSYACLSELHHYSSVSPFPGEPACGLPAAQAGDTTFSQTYLLDLGEDLTESEFRTATDSVAEYLFLNTATPSSAFFDQCRSLAASAPPSDDGPLLRSFGICRLGCSNEVPTAAANVLCRSLLERWTGEVRRTREEPVRRLAELPGMQTPAPEPAPSGFLRDSEIDRLANENAAKLNLDVDHVIMELYEAVERELGSDAESYVCRVVASLAAAQEHPASAPEQAPRTTQVLTEINVLLGCQSAEEDLGRPPTASLQTVLDDHLKKLAAGYGAAIRDWVVELVDVPAVRVKGAYRATEWFAGHLRSMKQLAGDMLAQTQEDAAAKQEELLESKMRFCLRESRDGKPALDLRFQQYARLRFLEIALTGVRRLAQLVSSHVSSTGDVLKEARRELGRLADEFSSETELPVSKSMSDDAPHAAEAIAAKIGADVTRLLPELAAQLDQQLQAQFVIANGGLCAVLAKLTELRRPLLRSLRFEARTAVLNRLSHMGVAKEILDPGTGEGEERFAVLRTSLAAATPKLLACGGAKRLLLATSDEAAAPLKEILHSEMHEQASLTPGSAGDVVLCYEVEQVSLEVAAVTLVEENSEYAQIAARLHTRVDVAWRPLAQPGVDTL